MLRTLNELPKPDRRARAPATSSVAASASSRAATSLSAAVESTFSLSESRLGLVPATISP
jgi:hypothetical protein